MLPTRAIRRPHRYENGIPTMFSSVRVSEYPFSCNFSPSIAPAMLGAYRLSQYSDGYLASIIIWNTSHLS